ncbi:MAG TPA: hypothetical protein VII73_07770 [Caulobacteraceae bacterium]
MNPAGHGPIGPQSAGLIVGLIVALGIVLLRNSRPRKLRIERLWIRPLIFMALMAGALAAAPPSPTALNIAILAMALVAGCALGWQRGRFMRIEVDPATHDLTSRASPLGMVFILVLIVGRMGLRSVLPRGGTVGELSALTLADALILLAAGMMVTQGLEMWLRARRLLAEAQAAKGGPAASPPIVR